MIIAHQSTEVPILKGFSYNSIFSWILQTLYLLLRTSFGQTFLSVLLLLLLLSCRKTLACGTLSWKVLFPTTHIFLGKQRPSPLYPTPFCWSWKLSSFQKAIRQFVLMFRNTPSFQLQRVINLTNDYHSILDLDRIVLACLCWTIKRLSTKFHLEGTK